MVENLRSRFRVVSAIMGVTLILTLVFTFIQPFEYRTDVRLLIIYQQTDRFDPYLFVKAEERLAESLAKIIFSSSFISKVQDSSYALPQEVFENDPIRLRKQWQKMVNIDTVPQSGLLRAHAFHKEKEVSLLLAAAIADTLVTSGKEYHGAGDKVVIKVVDAPVSTDRPVRPNVIANAVAGIFVGAVLSLVFLFVGLEYRSQEEGSLFVQAPSRKVSGVTAYDTSPYSVEEQEAKFSEVLEPDYSASGVHLEITQEKRAKVDWQKNGSVHKIVLKPLDSGEMKDS